MQDQELGLHSEWSPVYFPWCSSKFPRVDISLFLSVRKHFKSLTMLILPTDPTEKTLSGEAVSPSPPLAVNTAKESSGQNCCLGKNDAFSWKVSLKGSDLGSS